MNEKDEVKFMHKVQGLIKEYYEQVNKGVNIYMKALARLREIDVLLKHNVIDHKKAYELLKEFSFCEFRAGTGKIKQTNKNCGCSAGEGYS